MTVYGKRVLTIHVESVVAGLAFPRASGVGVGRREVLVVEAGGREVDVALDYLPFRGVRYHLAIHGSLGVAGDHLDGLSSNWTAEWLDWYWICLIVCSRLPKSRWVIKGTHDSLW